MNGCEIESNIPFLGGKLIPSSRVASLQRVIVRQSAYGWEEWFKSIASRVNYLIKI